MKAYFRQNLSQRFFALSTAMAVASFGTVAHAKFKLKLPKAVSKALGIPSCQGFSDCFKKNVVAVTAPVLSVVRVPAVQEKLCGSVQKCHDFETCTNAVLNCIGARVPPDPKPDPNDPNNGPSRTDEPIAIYLTAEPETCAVPCTVKITADVTTSADLSWSGCFNHPGPTRLTTVYCSATSPGVFSESVQATTLLGKKGSASISFEVTSLYSGGESTFSAPIIAALERCPTGYAGSRGTACVDIDECAVATSCPANSTCRNAPGSYVCLLNNGERCAVGSACASTNCNTSSGGGKCVAGCPAAKPRDPNSGNCSCPAGQLPLLEDGCSSPRVDQSFGPSVSNLGMAINHLYAFVGQTYTAGFTGRLTQVMVDVVGNASYPMRLSVLEFGSTPAEQVALGSVTLPGERWLWNEVISLGEGVPQIAGRRYAIVVDFPGAPQLNGGNWGGEVFDGYAGGGPIGSRDGINWSSAGAYDLHFQTWVVPTNPGGAH